ncbi:MAG: hypothetical protein AAFP70_11650 [Calditrichota bacterium]
MPENINEGRVSRQHEEVEILKELLCAIRSRLNVIGTTMYLLEDAVKLDTASKKRYFSKMKKEMETVRRLING